MEVPLKVNLRKVLCLARVTSLQHLVPPLVVRMMMFSIVMRMTMLSNSFASDGESALIWKKVTLARVYAALL